MPVKILAHRANLHGVNRTQENLLASLEEAVLKGFDVEFDINLPPDGARLTLTHDPAAWSEERDASVFLAAPGAGSFHALNLKHLLTVPAICHALTQAGTQKNFFWFDFELLTDDLTGCRFLMRSLAKTGFAVAYRLSDREPYLKQYLAQERISLIWLDAFEQVWDGPEQWAALRAEGKQVYCVSPELHGCDNLDILKRRWEQWQAWGAAGICTDYPMLLAQFLGEEK